MFNVSRQINWRTEESLTKCKYQSLITWTFRWAKNNQPDYQYLYYLWFLITGKSHPAQASYFHKFIGCTASEGKTRALKTLYFFRRSCLLISEFPGSIYFPYGTEYWTGDIFFDFLVAGYDSCTSSLSTFCLPGRKMIFQQMFYVYTKNNQW